jgi:hypothetical protein
LTFLTPLSRFGFFAWYFVILGFDGFTMPAIAGMLQRGAGRRGDF